MNLQPNRLAGQGDQRCAPEVHKLSVQCVMPQLGTEYVDIYYSGSSLLLVFGGDNPHARQYLDAIDFADAPELRDLHDGRGWHLASVMFLVAGLETADRGSFTPDAGIPYPTATNRPTV